MFTPFGPIFHTPWKGFYTGFDFFRGYKKGTLVWNELKQFWVNNEDTRLISTDAVQIPLFVGNKAKQQILNGGKKKTTHAKFYEKWKKKRFDTAKEMTGFYKKRNTGLRIRG